MKPSELHLLRQRLPFSESTIRRNLAPATDAVRQPPAPEPQRTVCPPLASALSDQKSGPVKCLIRIESRRVQLQDPDNGVEKWHIDALRYAGLISNDTTDEIEIRKWQTKVAHKCDEGTVITLSEIREISAEESAALYAKIHHEVNHSKI